jgi:hypothetical protein
MNAEPTIFDQPIDPVDPRGARVVRLQCRFPLAISVRIRSFQWLVRLRISLNRPA